MCTSATMHYSNAWMEKPASRQTTKRKVRTVNGLITGAIQVSGHWVRGRSAAGYQLLNHQTKQEMHHGILQPPFGRYNALLFFFFFKDKSEVLETYLTGVFFFCLFVCLFDYFVVCCCFFFKLYSSTNIPGNSMTRGFLSLLCVSE